MAKSDILLSPSLNLGISNNIHMDNNIKCLKCDKKFEFSVERDEYLAHLFLFHRLVIADVDDVADLREYLEYWIEAFKDKELEQFCTTMLLDQLPDGSPSSNEKYYLLSDILPQDYELRKKIHKAQLERALARHQFERSDKEFCKECLYCRDVIKGLRSDYLEHLFNKHFLQLGKPENLVYVDDLISTVQTNLESLICLYCEKVFKDRVMLKDHMRKKGHKRINPNNKSYDRFFLINYRIDKPKLKQMNRKSNEFKSEALPRLQFTRNTDKKSKDMNVNREEQDFDRIFNNSGGSDSDWSDWDGEKLLLHCLFCSDKDTDFKALKQHMLNEHQIDFDDSVKGLNFYQKVKIVNYTRRQICTLRCVMCNRRFDTMDDLLKHMKQEEHFTLGNKQQWDKPEFFFPTFDDDALLCILDDSINDSGLVDNVVPIMSEDPVVEINKDAEKLSLENFSFL